ncbi:hypothetical protein K438DRAFT_1972418 [Mycena galopus ATCC 62051]|nr:hypothetical protein K438DRAFT_1972418 [Mycena galopus ATCC 62051]
MPCPKRNFPKRKPKGENDASLFLHPRNQTLGTLISFLPSFLTRLGYVYSRIGPDSPASSPISEFSESRSQAGPSRDLKASLALTAHSTIQVQPTHTRSPLNTVEPSSARLLPYLNADHAEPPPHFGLLDFSSPSRRFPLRFSSLAQGAPHRPPNHDVFVSGVGGDMHVAGVRLTRPTHLTLDDDSPPILPARSG